MPFRSTSQQKYLFAKNPKIAKEFASVTPKSAYKTLPVKAKTKSPKSKVLGSLKS